MEQHKNTNLLAIIACLLWASAFVGIKIGSQYSPPIQFAGLRFFIAGLILLPFNKGIRNFAKECAKHWKICLVMTFFQVILNYTFFYIGLSKVSGALCAIVNGATPLFVALCAHWGLPDDKLNKHKIFSIILGLVGITLVSLDKSQLQNTTSIGALIFGIICFIIVDFNAGIINILLKKDNSGISPMSLCTATMILGGSSMYLGALPFEGFAGFVFPAPYYFSLTWLSLLAAGAFSIWFHIAKRPGVKISHINLWKFLIPVVGSILSWSILPNETPSLLAIIGMIITIIALFHMNYHIRKENSQTK